MASHPKDLLTPEEFLAIDRRSEFKSEYFGGETFGMAGGTKRHNLVAGNINRILGTQLLERDCNVYSKSTEAYDRGRQWEHYQRLDSVGDYLLVSQTPYRVEQFARQRGGS